MSKISGPLLDRIDIHIEVPAVPFQELSNGSRGTSSAAMREMVLSARTAQEERFAGERVRHNGQMSSRQVREHCKLDKEGMSILTSSVNEMGLSARAHDKVLRVARTIADLDQCSSISAQHIHEAVNYRMLDRQMWT